MRLRIPKKKGCKEGCRCKPTVQHPCEPSPLIFSKISKLITAITSIRHKFGTIATINQK
ncbi:hypothetical protein Hdeb2414_s0001g00013351 [Helianthus debilis subsp. tardiflorus]